MTEEDWNLLEEFQTRKLYRVDKRTPDGQSWATFYVVQTFLQLPDGSWKKWPGDHHFKELDDARQWLLSSTE